MRPVVGLAPTDAAAATRRKRPRGSIAAELKLDENDVELQTTVLQPKVELKPKAPADCPPSHLLEKSQRFFDVLHTALG